MDTLSDSVPSLMAPHPPKVRGGVVSFLDFLVPRMPLFGPLLGLPEAMSGREAMPAPTIRRRA